MSQEDIDHATSVYNEDVILLNKLQLK
jgi:hypothetical protein